MTGAASAWLRPAAAAGLLASAIGLQIARDAVYPLRARETTRVMYIQSPAVLSRLALEFRALAADVYWIRAIQHYGGDRLASDTRRRYELLQPLLDITTSLDPYFTIAYRFGAIFLSEAQPGGPGRPDQAIELLNKGIAAQPQKWQYYHDVAFVQYWHNHNPKSASEWFLRGAEQPGAPNWLRPLAATMMSARDRNSARLLWQQILTTSDQPWMRQTAERSLLQLQALDQIDQLQAVVNSAGVPAGTRVTWQLLIAQRRIPGTPLDSTGTPFEIDPATGQVELGSASTLNPLPDLNRSLR